MGKGGNPGGQTIQRGSRLISWEEIKQHTSHNDKWLVINGEVYDITNWARKHPGGSRVITHYAGQDASEAFRAFHIDFSKVNKYLNAIKIGNLEPSERIDQQDIVQDFRQLRELAEKMNLFKPSFWFYFLTLAHIIALEGVAYFTLLYFGIGWLPYLVSVIFFTTAQTQAGWIQHDFGHLSVFPNASLNHLLHNFVMGFLKGVSRTWWNHMHYQHHAKPNIIKKDPDVRLEKLFVVGEKMPIEIARKKIKTMPYNFQHKYFFIIGPPLLFPVYFQFMVFRHVFTRRAWNDLLWLSTFFIKFFYLFSPMLGIGGTILYYFVNRVFESHWFTWVSQSNHIPMEIDTDKDKPWLSLQMQATCDVQKSVFNDWFTGHLNFQIEHHLFPTMPRHNLYKIAPMVKSLCQKHNIKYEVKTLGQAFRDIVISLKHSGELWYEEFYHAEM